MITEAMKLAETVARTQFKELVNPGNYASNHFELKHWNIEQQIMRILKSHHKTHTASAKRINEAVAYGAAIWKDLIEGRV